MRNPWKVTTFALVALLACAVGRESRVQNASADTQPKMQQALGELRGAAVSLEQATHDKGGHRAKALELTRAAIGEVEAGIKFDNRH